MLNETFLVIFKHYAGGQIQVVGDGANLTEELFDLVKALENVLEIVQVVHPGTGAQIAFVIVLDIIEQILNKLSL